MTAPKRAGSLQQKVLTHANRVHRLLAAGDSPRAAERLAAEAAQWERDSTEVVVVGDIKRGKSSLVNALLGHPGLLPVDADVATAVHLVVRHGAELTVTATRVDPDTGESGSETLEVEDLPRYASMSGDLALQAGLTAVEVAVPHPLLERGLAIVDTPGVGGMTQGHRDITMAALARADVLVFTVSVQEPVSRTELEFLAEAGERIGSVIIVATRCDVVGQEQLERRITDIRDRILAQADRLAEAGSAETATRLRRLADAPIVPTSSFLAEQAKRRADRGNTEKAADLARASGIPALATRLAGTVDAKDLLRLANLLQLAGVLLAPRVAQQQTILAAAAGDESAAADLLAKKEQLEQAVGQQARWRSVLANAFTRLQTEAGRDVGRELTVVRDHYRTILEGETARKLTADDLSAISGQLGQSLHAAWSNLALQATGRFEDVVRDLMDELSLEADAEPGLLGEFSVPPNLADAGLPAGSGKSGFDVLEDGLPLAMQTFMFSNIATALVGVFGIATGGIGFLAYGIGAAASAPIVLLRRRQRDRRKMAGELLREINESLFGQEGIAREFTAELTLRILEARQELEVLIETRLTQRRKELETEHQQIQQLLKSEQSTRRQAQEAAERALTELRTVVDETTAMAAEVETRVRALFDAPAAASPEKVHQKS